MAAPMNVFLQQEVYQCMAKYPRGKPFSRTKDKEFNE